MRLIGSEQARVWRRTEGGVDASTGYASVSDGYTDLGLIDITVTPVDGDEPEILDSGVDLAKWKKGFTTSMDLEIIDGQAGEDGDVLEYKGEFYEVRHRRRYPEVIPHDRVLLKRTDRGAFDPA